MGISRTTFSQIGNIDKNKRQILTIINFLK